MEKEYLEITRLANAKRELQIQLADLEISLKQMDQEIADKSFFWTIGEDGLVEVGLGCF